MSLVHAGAAMAGTTGPVGTAIGRGIAAGAGALDKQRSELRSEQDHNDKADALFQHAKQHLDKYQRMTPYEQATSDWRQTASENRSMSSVEKKAKYLVAIGAHPDEASAVRELNTSIADPSRRATLEKEYVKIILTNDPTVAGDIDKAKTKAHQIVEEEYARRANAAPATPAVGTRKVFRGANGEDAPAIWDGSRWKPEPKPEA
jgi:hypothetical protein